MVITDLAIFKFISGRLTLTELMPRATLDEAQDKTSADFMVNLKN